MLFEKAATRLSRTLASTATLKLAEMHKLDIFYTPLEERFERITRLARRAMNVPIAAVTILNPEKQWFKSVSGWAVSELPISQSLCALTIEENRVNIVTNAASDPRYSDHPLVAGKPHFRFYAGYPLHDEDGNVNATFCIFDLKPRELSASDLQTFRDLGTMAQSELATDSLNDAQGELISKLSAARREAMIDPLTRLWNRRGASALLRSAIKRADDQRTQIAVGMIDLDKFKRINDAYGHQIGDEVLRKIARTLVGCLRGEDIVCRPGGDEFLLIMTDTTEKQAAQIAERVRRSVSESPVPTRQGVMPMTVSVGYAVRAPGDGRTEDDVVKEADEALMQSKEAGRNRVRAAS